MSGEAILVIGQLHLGGAEGQLVRLAAGLRGSRYEPVVACLSELSEPHGSRLAAAGVPVEVFHRKGSRDLTRLRALGRFLRSRRAAVVHSWLVGANAYAYGAARLSGVGPFIASSRTTMTIPGKGPRVVHGWVFRHADAVIANSERVKEFTSNYYGVDPGRVRVVPNGVDLDAHSGEPLAGEPFRKEMEAAEGELLVGTLGRLSREKNIELFIEAAAALARPSVGFVIIGDGPERSRLEELARRKAPGARIRFAGARSDVAAVLAGLDLFVLTSRTEGMPNAVMEAMASARPVITTRVGGIEEVVTDGVTGRIIDGGGTDSLVRVLDPLLVNEGERLAMGRAGRRKIEDGFSVEAMVSRTVAVYDGLRRNR